MSSLFKNRPRTPATPTGLPPLIGRVDECRGLAVRGWAHQPGQTAPATVELWGDGQLLAQGLADGFRDDLAKNGMGDGFCAFRLELPLRLLDGRRHALEVRAQGVRLPGEELVIESDPASGLLRTVKASRHAGPGPWQDTEAQVALADPAFGVMVLLSSPARAALPDAASLLACGIGLGRFRLERLDLPVAAGRSLWAVRAQASELRPAPGDGGSPLPAQLTLALGGPAGQSDWALPLDTAMDAPAFFRELGRHYGASHLDVAFYKAWHADVELMTDEEASAHFAVFGHREGRPANFGQAMQQVLPDTPALPADFDWQAYLAINQDLLQHGPLNRYRAAEHYLRRGRAEQRDYRIDARFYAEYYLDEPVQPAADNASDPQFQARVSSHFLSHARHGHVATFNEWLRSRHWTLAQLLEPADLSALRLDWQGRSGRTFWSTLRAVLLQDEPPVPLALARDPALERHIVTRLARAFQLSGQAARGRALMQALGDDQPLADQDEAPIDLRHGGPMHALLVRLGARHAGPAAWLLRQVPDAPLPIGLDDLPASQDTTPLTATLAGLNLLRDAGFQHGLAAWRACQGAGIVELAASGADRCRGLRISVAKPQGQSAVEQLVALPGWPAPGQNPLSASACLAADGGQAHLVVDCLAANGQVLARHRSAPVRTPGRPPEHPHGQVPVLVHFVPPAAAVAARLRIELVAEPGTAARTWLQATRPALAWGRLSAGQTVPAAAPDFALDLVRAATPVPLERLQALGERMAGESLRCSLVVDGLDPRELDRVGPQTDSPLGAFTAVFDEDWYRSTYGLTADDNAWWHFLGHGAHNLLAPNPLLSLLEVAEAHPELLHADRPSSTATATALALWQQGVRTASALAAPAPETERSRPLLSPAQLAFARAVFAFNPQAYLDSRPDLAGSGIDAFEHYRLHGEREGGRPNAYFDPVYYRSRHLPAGWRGLALAHFLSVGLLRGLPPSAQVAEAIARSGASGPAEWALRWGRSDVISPLSVRRLPPATVIEEETLPQDDLPPKLGLGEVRHRRLNWVIPRFSKGGGGHTTIFRTARTLARLGWQSVFWLLDTTTEADVAQQAQEYLLHFPTSRVSFKALDDSFEALTHEVLIATAWQSVTATLDNRQPNARLYFVQDNEPLFNSAGTDSIRAEWTYRQGFDFVCAGRWLQQMVSAYPGRNMSFELCAEPQFSARDPQLTEREVLAAVYIRTHTSRRCSDLMLDVAGRLAAAGQGQVLIFGDDSRNLKLPPGVLNMGILSSQQMADLFARSRFGLVASATNYSILPVEMAASGLIVCQPESLSTLETTVSRGIHSFPPDAARMARGILSLARDLDQARFDALRGRYMDFARSVSWESEFEALDRWLTPYLSPAAAARPPAPRVTVVIPTYRPDDLLRQCVEAIDRQLCSAAVDTLIMDTRVPGQAPAPVVAALAGRPGLRIIEVDVKDFGHASTRQAAALATDADHVVYLTQDAVPDGPYWLESLLAPLHLREDCAWVFGRHRAHPGHPAMCDEELRAHFDAFAARGAYVQRRDLGAAYETDPYVQAHASFNSDNNAAYRGDLLRTLGFPDVPFAEDQAVARRFLDAGYAGGYANHAVVMHSHDYEDDLATAATRGEEEAQALFTNFGTVRYPTAQAFLNDLSAAQEGIRGLGLKAGLCADQVERFLRVKQAYMQGVFRRSQALQAADR